MIDLKHISLIILGAIGLAMIGYSIYGVLNDPTFDPQLAIDIDYYSKVSYCDIDVINSWTCGKSCQYHPGMQEVQAYNDKVKQAQGYCGYDSKNNRVVAAFRGSSNIPNWIDDFEFVSVVYPDCKGCLVHDGFKATLKEISPQINACIQNLANKYPTAQVIVTGHSLGAALATLSVLEVSKFIDNSRITFINFGSPRVGNLKFATYFVSQIPNARRVVNYKDIVPHVPFQDMDFKHINSEVWMLYNGSVDDYQVCPQEEQKNCSDSVKILSIPDHTNYFGFDTGC